MRMIRAPDLRRSLLFVAGADGAAHTQALQSQPDVLVQDLEDFTPQQSKQAAREMSADLFARARARGIIPAVRVNLLSGLGMIDLAAVVPARPELILLQAPQSAENSRPSALPRALVRLLFAQSPVRHIPTRILRVAKSHRSRQLGYRSNSTHNSKSKRTSRPSLQPLPN